MRALTHSIVAALAIATVLVAGTNWADSTAAATVSAKWDTQIQVSGVRAQGSATLYAYTTGAGALGLRLTGLNPSTSYWVGLYSGSCSALGTRVLLLRTVTSTASGTVTRGLTLTAALTARLRTLLRGHLSVAIGSVRRCGTLAPLLLSPAPTPTPTPTPEATPTPTPTPTPYDPAPMPPPMY